MSSAPLAVSVTRTVDADANTLYDLIADVTSMPKYSPENVAGDWLDGATCAVVGARFKGRNKLGPNSWSTKPTVTVADRGRTFAFKVPGRAGPTWTYTFAPADGGTQVTESAVQTKRSPLPIRLLQRRAGVTDRATNLESAMRITLDRLALVAEAHQPATVRATR